MGVAVVVAILALTGVAGIRERAAPLPKRNVAVNIPPRVSDGGVAQGGRINALRQQGKGVQEIQVLGVVVESNRSFDFAAANPEPRFEPIVGVRPVERGMPASKLTEITVINLRPNAKLVGDLHRGVGPKISKFTTADVTRVHGQPIVVVGVDESLRGKPVDLDLPVKEFEFLRLQREPGCAEAKEQQQNGPSAHSPLGEVAGPPENQESHNEPIGSP